MFNSKDFEVFQDPTLNGRLEKIKEIIDPKFEKFGNDLLKEYQKDFSKDLYIHIAKHLRRHKNPPPDTWFAISMNKRGYKAYPHLELGFWPDCFFTNISFLTELSDRKQIVEILNDNIQFNKGLGISGDHTNSDLELMDKKNFKKIVNRYLNVKSADLVIGFKYERESFLNEEMINNLPILFDILNKFEK
ncbi:DUF1054 family protein [Companilactobacillus sp. DQM5]|uniref:DUF1054 family protein n=1 Tax=Companilactobacillus sp. DQM5 TaxID=3463359 RepID=UPI00405A222C